MDCPAQIWGLGALVASPENGGADNPPGPCSRWHPEGEAPSGGRPSTPWRAANTGPRRDTRGSTCAVREKGVCAGRSGH